MTATKINQFTLGFTCPKSKNYPPLSPSMSTTWLISVSPNVHQTHGRMKPIEHDEWQRQMVQDAPQDIAIKVISAKIKIQEHLFH